MLIITRSWQHENEPTRIHYILKNEEGGSRHLYEDEGSALYEQLLSVTPNTQASEMETV